MAFQGGGAKFVTLLAAVEALQNMRSAGHIKYSQVVGSSAGGLAAVLLGLDCDMKKLRAYLGSQEAKSALSEIMSFDLGFWGLVKLARGGSLADEHRVRALFQRILIETTGYRDNQTPNFTCKTSVIVTNINTSQAEVIELNGKLIRDIAGNLVDTCAIPLAFRGFKSKPNAHLLDGGLFENFPTGCLSSDSYPGGRILGVTFDKRTHEEQNSGFSLKEYASRILSSAIDGNMAPAMKSIHGENIVNLPDRWGTLEILQAVNAIGSNKDDHEIIRNNVIAKLHEIKLRESQISNLAKIKARATIPQSYDQVRDSATILASMRMSKQLSKRTYAYLELQSLSRSSVGDRGRLSDYYFHKTFYRVPTDGIECIHLVISEFVDESDFALYADFSIIDDKANSIDHTVFPLRRIEGTSNFRSIALFFKQRLYPSDTEWICLTQREMLPNQFEGLRTRGWEYLEFANMHDGIYEELEVFVGVPIGMDSQIQVKVADRQYDHESTVGRLVTGVHAHASPAISDAINPGFRVTGFKIDSQMTGDGLFSVFIIDQKLCPNFDGLDIVSESH
nr:patatin-like phospholipase family protein [Gemmobacter caeni]